MTPPTLLQLVEADLGPPARSNGLNYWFKCPWHHESNASFQVDYYEDKWHWQCWHDMTRRGDAFDWLTVYRGMSNAGAWRFLHGDGVPPDRVQPKPRAVEYSDPPPEAWQDAALDAVLECAAELQSGEGTAGAALCWLLDRGLERSTIERALLGFNPTWRDVNGSKLPPGITIPCFVERGGLWYVQVRLTKAEAARLGRKYMALAGSKLATLYNADKVLGARAALAVEGEFDALLADQLLGGQLPVITMGSATTAPGPRWLRYLSWLDQLLVVQDADEAGATGSGKWAELAAWVEILDPPAGVPGKDITDWHRAGFDVAGYVLEALQQDDRGAATGKKEPPQAGTSGGNGRR